MTQSKSIADKIYNKMCEIERVISLQGKDDRGHLMFAGFRQCMSELKDVIDSLKLEPQAQSVEAEGLHPIAADILQRAKNLTHTIGRGTPTQVDVVALDPLESACIFASREFTDQPQQSVEADGYVAWHRKFKTLKARTRPHEIAYQSEDAAWYALQVFRMSTCKTRERLTEEGWQIRPVKLQFLDEGKCKKE